MELKKRINWEASDKLLAERSLQEEQNNHFLMSWFPHSGGRRSHSSHIYLTRVSSLLYYSFHYFYVDIQWKNSSF